MKNSIGMCLGATTVTLAQRKMGQVSFRSIKHNGKVAHVVRELAGECLPAKVVITGRRFRNLFCLPSIPEPEAVEVAYAAVRERYSSVDCIVSFGGETIIAYGLDHNGRISSVHTGNRCASGTGEFFLQQVRRMGLTLERAVEMGGGADIYPVSSRCSVFCKSDCTHALNKGISIGAVTAGLARMAAGKILELLNKINPSRLLVVGGGSSNSLVVRFIREVYPETIVPREAVGFEAYGALLCGERQEAFFSELPSGKAAQTSFPLLPPLDQGINRVHFHSSTRGEIVEGDYLLGVDVGSTTTKAALVSKEGLQIVAASYLPTNGDPVQAVRRCYSELLAQIPAGTAIDIKGLGVTGSGRQIAGLHAGTLCVINEIIAHAAAAVHFDSTVDTIFEIGGQDAKYTYLAGGVASEYAMNEACSAGTGSFLEEACGESFSIGPGEIADLALCASHPPDFSDQCAAFISSDIKTAMQENISREDILAGLVYSVCRNYLNRVKGLRPVGSKIFMQGGVCYNKAVPAAMAILCGRDIVVPPDPGLMGAFGAALQTLRSQKPGPEAMMRFNLADLSSRKLAYGKPFTCNGGKEGCDRKCNIARIIVAGKAHPFGGACDRFYNLRSGAGTDTAPDLVRLREERLLPSTAPVKAAARTIGLLPSLFGATYFPLYERFFELLGFSTLRPPTSDPQGVERAASSFCRPLIYSHGYLEALLRMRPDLIFLPRVARVEVEGGDVNCTCPFVQAEADLLKSAFQSDGEGRFIEAHLAFDNERLVEKEFAAVAARLGAERKRGCLAFRQAWREYRAIVEELRREAGKMLQGLSPGATGIVLFGRPYNAFTRESNLGIPHKFTSRGYPVIPHDLLLGEPGNDHLLGSMYWASGQSILKVAQYVRNNPSLFGVYITSFSCGPDSFLTGYFRRIMGRKPSLVLEIDDHTADAGIDTRIEAFLAVARGYREVGAAGEQETVLPEIAQVCRTGAGFGIITTDGKFHSFADPNVRLLLPSMGETGSAALAAAFRYEGIPAVAAPRPERKELSLGKGEVGGKECLPLILTTGSLLRYLEEEKKMGQVLAFLMPWAEGPCRFGQYRVFFEELFRRKGIGDIALLSPNGEDGYSGLSSSLNRRAYLSTLLSDGLEDIRAALMALADDPEAAHALYRDGVKRILTSIGRQSLSQVLDVTREEMERFARIPLKMHPSEATRVLLAGEIYARREGLPRRQLVERLAALGLVVRTAPVAEWLRYCDSCVARRLSVRSGFRQRLRVWLRRPVMRRYERLAAAVLSISGLVEVETTDVEWLLDRTAPLLDTRVTGEAVLTVGSSLTEIGDQVHGAISIGPFGCMPCRIAEALLNSRLAEEKQNFSHLHSRFWEKNKGRFSLPFLTIETDGSPFSQIVEARLEVFILAAHRLKDELRRAREVGDQGPGTGGQGPETGDWGLGTGKGNK